MLANEQLSSGKGPTSPVGTQHTPTVIETSPQLQNLSIAYRKTRNRTRRTGIRIPQSNVLSSVTDEAITKEMHDRLGRATTTASSLEADQGSGNIFKTQTKATPSRPSSLRTSSEGGPCKVTTLENELNSTKVVHNKAFITLTKRERMIEEIDKDENVNLVKSSKQGEAHDTAGHRMESDDIEVVDFSTTNPQNDEDEVNLTETLVNIKMSATKDKGKAIMQESEPPKKLKKKEMIQIGHDEELAQKLHAEELVKDTARQEQEIDRGGNFDLQQESSKQVEEEIFQQDDVVFEQVVKESSRKAEGRLKKIFILENHYSQALIRWKLYNLLWASLFGRLARLDYRMVVREIEDVLLEEMEKFGLWFEQDIDGENEDDNENKLVMVNEEGWMS
ncbi:hypothetical protein Tco_0858347 [Tanacetum coccineum]|uniref:DUF4378 domain-containing protein n=1 Tax=Tanacetum coccineum TaxID=301880 RepID=A0ABQ5B8Y9_9ASTR